MTRYLLCAAVLVIAGPGVAQSSDWSRAETVEITMASFSYSPETIRLEHGRPYRLHFVNAAGGGHNFVAREFFDAATIAPEDRAKVSDGRVELAGGASVDIRLMIARPGSYEVHCSHFLHSTFGMTGAIAVR